MTYEQVASITQVAALLLFVALFIGVLIYAFWPGNKKRFEEAARLPLEKDPEPEQERDGKRHGKR
jgi:cytochrome c oxidase cbb3-type subunit 4